MFARFRGIQMDRRDIKNLSNSFNGNFATLFPGAFQVVQTDRGLTYGATPLATAGNTSTTVLTLSGTITGPYIPVLAKATNTLAIGAGATFNIYYDGVGTLPAMSGVTPTAGTPVALTGAGAGLFIAWAAGTSVTNDTWNATAAGLADQTLNGKNATQATATKQPILTIGVNGKPELLHDGVDDELDSSVGSLIGGAVPYQIIIVARRLVNTPSRAYVGGASNTGVVYCQVGSDVTMFSGSTGPSTPYSSAVQTRISATFTGSTSDSLKVGALAPVSGVSAGAQVTASRTIGTNVAMFGNMALLAVIYTPPISAGQLAAFDAALNSPAGYGVGAIAV